MKELGTFILIVTAIMSLITVTAENRVKAAEADKARLQARVETLENDIVRNRVKEFEKKPEKDELGDAIKESKEAQQGSKKAAKDVEKNKLRLQRSEERKKRADEKLNQSDKNLDKAIEKEKDKVEDRVRKEISTNTK